MNRDWALEQIKLNDKRLDGKVLVKLIIFSRFAEVGCWVMREALRGVLDMSRILWKRVLVLRGTEVRKMPRIDLKNVLNSNRSCKDTKFHFLFIEAKNFQLYWLSGRPQEPPIHRLLRNSISSAQQNPPMDSKSSFKLSINLTQQLQSISLRFLKTQSLSIASQVREKKKFFCLFQNHWKSMRFSFA